MRQLCLAIKDPKKTTERASNNSFTTMAKTVGFLGVESVRWSRAGAGHSEAVRRKHPQVD